MDVRRLEIPTPFRVGPINCYLLPEPTVTLIDPGPATDDAYAALESQLEQEGRAIADVEQVLITHPHMDHFGLANRVSEASRARVLAHADAVRRLEVPFEFFDHEQAFFTRFLQSVGVPEDIAVATTTLPEPYLQFQEPVSVDRILNEGATVDAGRDLAVVHTPGHAPGSVCFLDRESSAAFTGDHVLSGISPNPFLTLAPGATDERTRSLPAYVDSLRKLRPHDIATGYGGHGARIADLDGRIHEILDHHRERKETMLELLTEIGPATAYQLMGELFPDLPTTEAFAGISETVGHLDLLEDDGRIEPIEDGGPVRYRIST